MKRALVTGASGAIGAAICLVLAKQGVHVIAHCRGEVHRVLPLVEKIEAAGGQASAVSFNINDDAQAAAAISRLLESGPIQILVNNAGMHNDALMAGMSMQKWRDVINTNLNGFFRVTQPLVLPMVRTRWGRIITISSVAGLLGNRGQANYAAAKAGLHAASKSLSLEVASRGVTVNVVAPGIINTSMTKSVFTPERVQELVPAGRAGAPVDVAALVAFLASDQAGYITGQVISVNGGLC